MKPLLKCIISGLVILLPFISKGQDSLKTNQRKLALQISIDYGKGIESLLQKQQKWEFGANLILNQHYNFVGEYGFGNLNPESVIQNGTYNSKGNYFRGGVEYIFTIMPKRLLSAGVMYANRKVTDSGNVIIHSELWDDVNESFQRKDLSATWVEVILNTEGPIYNTESGFFTNVYWGIRFRLRILLSDIEQPDFDIYAIPGYGRTYSTVVPAANFFVKYRFDF